ncbi:hypothetical protein ABG768_012781 [Culter alburnus]|uniref:non-specific serine/threonine protein kinase n=1 Tax=Culter alburnus TaxID=194366 RepID=A0AAW2B329_CULAL
MPMRKRKRMDCFEKLPSPHFCDWSGSSVQETATKYKRSAEDQNSLQYSTCVLEDYGLQEPLSSSLEVLTPADQQVQTPPASVHLSPAPDHNNRVDVTAEDDILNRYEIGRKLDEGGCGSVFEGKRLEDDLEIIELLDWQDQPDQYIMVLERPPSCQDLLAFLNSQEGFLNEEAARFIMTQTTMAAHMCCRRGVFHSDIKLENLLINTETLEVKLIDFGCGDLLQESTYDLFCGTEEYCPPECYTDGKYHVLLFVLLCRRFPEPNDLEKIYDGIWSEPDLSNGDGIHHIKDAQTVSAKFKGII